MFCPHCGKEVTEGQLFCQHCGNKLAEPATASGRMRTPWEDRAEQGFFGGLFKTLKASLFRPSEFFRTMPVTGGLTDPLLYALIVGTVGTMFSYLWQTLLQGAMQGFIPPEVASRYQLFQQFNIAALAISTPFLIIIGLFVVAVIFHVLLALVRGARSGYEATFRVVSYCASPLVFHIIPFCGGFVSMLWSLVLFIVGLREAHQTSGGKAAFAVLFPLVLCCGLVAMLMLLFFGAVAASFGTMHQ